METPLRIVSFTARCARCGRRYGCEVGGVPSVVSDKAYGASLLIAILGSNASQEQKQAAVDTLGPDGLCPTCEKEEACGHR